MIFFKDVLYIVVPCPLPSMTGLMEGMLLSSLCLVCIFHLCVVQEVPLLTKSGMNYDDDFTSAQSNIQSCISDTLSWMQSNKLKLNTEKN